MFNPLRSTKRPLASLALLLCFAQSTFAVSESKKLSPEAKKAHQQQSQTLTAKSADKTRRVIVGYHLDQAATTNSSLSFFDQRKLQIQAAQASLTAKYKKYQAHNIKHFQNLAYSSMQVSDEAISVISNDRNVTAIFADTLSKPLLSDSSILIGATNSASAGFSGQGQVVAIIDTGVDKTHSFLSGKVVHEACFSTTNTSNGSTSVCPGGAASRVGSGAGTACSNSISGCSHGTHIAGIAAGKGASFSGIAKDANIISIQVFSRFSDTRLCGSSGPCVLSYTSDQLSALDHIYSQRNNYNIAAVNMSLGGGEFSTLCDGNPLKAGIDLLRSAGIATVVASGNDGFSSAISAPACISSAISVGSTTKVDTVSSFSNSASFLDLLAPGGSINSSVPGNTFASFSGTSMAAPHVSGAIAILKSVKPDASIDQIENALKQTGALVTDSRNNISIPRIDVNSARSALTPSTTPKLFVSPSNALNVVGPVGGPFTPNSYSFTLRNITSSSSALNYAVTESASWLTVTNGSGQIPANGSTTVTVTVNATANNLSVNDYSTTLLFRNNTNASGNLNIAATLSVTDDNDFYANAIDIGRGGKHTGSTTGNNSTATSENNEPDHAKASGDHSLWWKWLAPANGEMTINTCSSDFDTVLAIYTGTSLQLLSETVSNDDACNLQSEVTWDARAGVLYLIAVDGYVQGPGNTGNVNLAWDFSADTTASPSISVLPTTGRAFSGASSGPFTPTSATYSVTNVGSGTQAIAVQTPAWLTPSKSNVVLAPGAQTTVSFSVNSQANLLPPGVYDGLIDLGFTARAVTLNLTSGTLRNNNFASASVISDGPQTIAWNNDLANKESGEPSHAGNNGGKSVWWKWTPTLNTNVTVNTEGSTFDTLLGVYRGNRVNSLSVVASDDDAGSGLLSSVDIDVVAGATYYIAVDGFNSGSEIDSGQLKLNIEYERQSLRNDFNADGRSDILWRQINTGENYLYTMDAFTVLSNRAINTVSNLGWEVKAINDFNGDKKADILWRHSTTGENWIYLMNGHQILSSLRLNKIAPNWKVAGTGDFDGDGKGDILWRHATVGSNWVYLMDGHKIRSSQEINKVADLNWEIQAVGDFNADGKDDIFWRHTANGLNWIYLMNGSRIAGSNQVNRVTDHAWQVAGVGDFNGDGKSDLFWRHANNGLNWLYLMNGSRLAIESKVNLVSDLNWKVEDVGDYNGDGLSGDILWRHQVTGDNWLYLMNTQKITLDSKINDVGLNWQIAPQ